MRALGSAQKKDLAVHPLLTVPIADAPLLATRSRLDSYSNGMVVAVGIAMAPCGEQGRARNRYRNALTTEIRYVYI